MPDRILKDSYGEGVKAQKLSFHAYLAFPFILRAADNYGCFRNNLQLIRDKAFKGRIEPTVKQLEKWMSEYLKIGILFSWDRYCFIPSWFESNRLRDQCKPTTPCPPPLIGTIYENKWRVWESDAASCGHSSHLSSKEKLKEEEKEEEGKRVLLSPDFRSRFTDEYIKTFSVNPDEIEINQAADIAEQIGEEDLFHLLEHYASKQYAKWASLLGEFIGARERALKSKKKIRSKKAKEPKDV